MLELLGFGLKVIPGLFTTINGITTAISNEKIKSIEAKTDQDRIAADERVHTLEAQRDVLLAGYGQSKAQIYIQTFIGAAVAFTVAKLLVWDKALGDWTHGHTDPLGDDLRWVLMSTIGFYFLSTAKFFNAKK